jgi:hypothetical protein
LEEFLAGDGKTLGLDEWMRRYWRMKEESSLWSISALKGGENCGRDNGGDGVGFRMENRLGIGRWWMRERGMEMTGITRVRRVVIVALFLL